MPIELIPWHTKDTKNINSYIENNIRQIFTNSILFAANESRRIANSKLKNKVLLRISGKKTIQLLEWLNRKHTIIHPIGYTDILGGGGNGGFLKFKFNIGINDIEFISIWDREGGNNFPKDDNDMDLIFRHII